MTVGSQEADICGVQPPVSQGSGGFLRHLVVALEDARASGEDLAVWGDADLRFWKWCSHRVEPHVAIPVQDRNPGDLGLAVDLLEVHADGMEEAEVVGSQCRAACVRSSHPDQAQMIAEFLMNCQISEVSQGLKPPRNRFLGHPKVCDPPSCTHRPFVHSSFWAGGIQVADLYRSNHLLVNSRWRKEDMRGDLSDVLLDRLWTLRKIDGESSLEPARDRHHLLPDPRKRQEGNEIIVLLARIHCNHVLTHLQHIVVSK